MCITEVVPFFLSGEKRARAEVEAMTERGAEVRNANGAEIGNGKRAEAGKGNGAEAKNADAADLGVEIADSEAAIEVPSRLFVQNCMCAAPVLQCGRLKFHFLLSRLISNYHIKEGERLSLRNVNKYRMKERRTVIVIFYFSFLAKHR